MPKRLTEIRRYNHDNNQPWIVDILENNNGRNGYVLPNGTAGMARKGHGFYDAKADAEKAEALYLDSVGVSSTSSTGKETNPKDVIGMKKAPISTLSCAVLFEMGLGMLEGARKYGRHNYRAAGVSATVYYDAAMRHLMDWWEGEDIDSDSGLNHVTKALTCLATLRDSMLMGNWIDDRPLRNPIKMKEKNAKVTEIIEKYPDCIVPYTEANKGLDRSKPIDRTKPVAGGY